MSSPIEVYGEYYFVAGLSRWIEISKDKIILKKHEEAESLLGVVTFSSVESINYDAKKLCVEVVLNTGKTFEFVSLSTKNYNFFLESLMSVGRAPESYVMEAKFNKLEFIVASQKKEIKELNEAVKGQKNLIERMKNIIRSQLGEKILLELQVNNPDGAFLGDVVNKVIDFETIKQQIDSDFKREGIIGMLTRDAIIWRKTFDNCNPAIKGVLTRILCTLRWGSLMFRVRDSKDWELWNDRNWPIVSALSHGGRVIIQLPPFIPGKSKYGKHGFWKWLISGNPECYLSEAISLKTSGAECRKEGKYIFKRLGSTHSIQVFCEDEADIAKKIGFYRKNGEFYDFFLPYGRQKIVYEKKSIELANLLLSSGQEGVEKSYTSHRHWGMNLPLGGENHNRLDGALISADGSNGHLYVYYLRPKEGRFGAIMLGLEGSEYGKADSTGMKHTIRAKSNPYSPTFGYKWFSKKHNDLRPFKCPDKYNSMLVDLTITGWEFLMDKRKFWKDDMIYATSQKAEPLTRDVEGIEIYVDLLRKKKNKRGFMSSISKGAKRFSRNLSSSKKKE